MAYTPHNPVKPEVLAQTAVKLVDQEVMVPNLFTKKGVDEFKGADNDTLNMIVPGVLPFHEWGWRNDRSAPIKLDSYAERKISVSFGGNVYSASELTDEQRDFDTQLNGWGTLLEAQARAVGRGLEARAIEKLESAPYEVVIKPKSEGGADISKSLVEARRVLNRFHAPGRGRVLLVGSDFDAALQNADLFNIAQNVGDANASNALREATIGRWKEFTIIHSAEIAPDAAYALGEGGFVFLNAAPSVPQSVGFGATAAFNGIALRVMQDYDPMYLRDRAITNTYAGFDYVSDPLRYLVTNGEGNRVEKVSDSEYFIRAIKLTLSGDEVYPELGSELANATGVGKDLLV
jgi:hypothetical protein